MQEHDKDSFEIARDNLLEELRTCQILKKLESCLQCEFVLGCALRKKYVDSVYASMNKGHGGGFEF